MYIPTSVSGRHGKLTSRPSGKAFWPIQTRSTTDFLMVRGHFMGEGCPIFRSALELIGQHHRRHQQTPAHPNV